MRERPIIFNGEMVRAILDRRKRQTRRVIKPQPTTAVTWGCIGGQGFGFIWNEKVHRKYALGDLLWVKETFAKSTDARSTKFKDEILYRADFEAPTYRWKSNAHFDGNWKPSIYMPRWASRITLEIKNVRVERVRDISTEECTLEGINNFPWVDKRDAFMLLWNSINEKRGYGWDKNPWVWVIDFEQWDFSEREER